MPTPLHQVLTGWTRTLVRLCVSWAALAVSVAGIPYVLYVSAGKPWPDRIASWDDLLTRLQQPVSDLFVMRGLALIGEHAQWH